MDKAPDAFRTISEVAEDLDLPQHVLRFWETRFTQIKPLKRGGGRRYYRPDDVELLRGIRHLLYGEGYTIKGVQRILKEEGPRYVMAIWRQPVGTVIAPPRGGASALPHSGETPRPRAESDEPDDDLIDGDAFQDDSDAASDDAAPFDDDDGGEPDAGMRGAESASPETMRPEAPRAAPARSDRPQRDPARPDLSRLVGSDASLLTDADITRLQSVLFDLGECRRLIAQALASDGADGETDGDG